jgi:hypothetical protein
MPSHKKEKKRKRKSSTKDGRSKHKRRKVLEVDPLAVANSHDPHQLQGATPEMGMVYKNVSGPVQEEPPPEELEVFAPHRRANRSLESVQIDRLDAVNSLTDANTFMFR